MKVFIVDKKYLESIKNYLHELLSDIIIDKCDDCYAHYDNCGDKYVKYCELCSRKCKGCTAINIVFELNIIREDDWKAWIAIKTNETFIFGIRPDIIFIRILCDLDVTFREEIGFRNLLMDLNYDFRYLLRNIVYRIHRSWEIIKNKRLKLKWE